jgi:signal transduction histidine kinase
MKPVVMFVLSGLVTMLLVGIAGGIVLQDLGRRQAVREAERLATVTGHELIEPRLTNGVLRRSSVSLLRLETVVVAVLQDPIEHVRVCDTSGRILYSDVPELIDTECQLVGSPGMAEDGSGRAAAPLDLVTSGVPSDPSGEGLITVTVPLQTPDERTVLFQAFLRMDSILTNASTLWRPFLPVMALALLALAMLQIPLAYRLARRVSRGQQEQERLLARAVASADLERRRLAADLHDGPVQAFSSIAMTLAARAEITQQRDPALGAALSDAAEETREGVRALRSALVSAYPPVIGADGLGPAVATLATTVREAGIRCFIEIPRPLHVPTSVEQLLFRACQEALRNVVAHSEALEATVRAWTREGVAGIEIRDDGIGFDGWPDERAQEEGHLGLRLLGDLARDAGGTLHVESAPGEGTAVRLEVPLQ